MIFFFLLEINMNLDFLIFKVSLFEASQIKTFSSSELTSFSKRSRLSFWEHKKVSSANNLIKKFVAVGKSLLKISEKVPVLLGEMVSYHHLGVFQSLTSKENIISYHTTHISNDNHRF